MPLGQHIFDVFQLAGLQGRELALEEPDVVFQRIPHDKAQIGQAALGGELPTLVGAKVMAWPFAMPHAPSMAAKGASQEADVPPLLPAPLV